MDYINNAFNKIKPKNIIISIDSNAHSMNWFNSSEDGRGVILNDFLAQNNLILHNNNEQNPTFYAIRNNQIFRSSIDLTISNLSASTMVNNWHIIDTESLSDHRIIVFDIINQINKTEFKSTIKFNTKTAD